MSSAQTKMNLTATNEEVDAKLAEMKAPYTEEQFQERLKASNQTVDDLKHALRRNLTIGKLLNKEINSKITVTDADVANYYNKNKAEFNLRETQYHLAQIQVTGIPTAQAGNLQNSKATNDFDAKRKIQALKNRLDSGEDFGTLAMNFSEQPETAPNGGDMGFVGESQMHADPAIFTAVTKLKQGEVTEILPLLDGQTKRPVGYAIYKLLSRDPPGQRDLNDPRVQQAIRQQLHDGRSQFAQGSIPGDVARSGEGGELLRGTDCEERRALKPQYFRSGVMTRSRVRFAILGFGLHAVRRLLPAFSQCKEATLSGMWRRNQAAAAQDCAKYGIANCFPSREALCASTEVDVVMITSPDAMHRGRSAAGVEAWQGSVVREACRDERDRSRRDVCRG